jgi:PAS domain S-box-containing protein
MLDLLSQMSLEGVFQYVSPAHERVLGYAPQQMVGTSVLDLLHPDDIAPVTAIMEAAIRNASSGQAEFRYQHADGHYVWLETVGRLLLDDRGIPVGAVLSGRDVTARKRAEDALRQLSVELEQRVLERTAQLDAANKELEAFSYSVSHDLRTPLRYMDGFSKILLDGYSAQLDDRGRRALNHIQAASARMGQLINDLLSLSRVSRQPLRRQRVDLSALARGVAADLQAANPGRTVDLVFADGIIAPGDPSLLRVVLENLLGNAWKYSTKRPQARIEFGAMSIAEYGRIADSRMQDHSATPGSFNPQSEIRNPQVVYFVRDNGAGFDPAFSDKLFAPFQRLHSEAEFEGTGIGLAIVARIVRRHGGDIWAEGAVEQGATFYFTLGDG